MLQSTRFNYVKYDETATAKSAAFKAKFQEIEELVEGLLGYSAGPRAATQTSRARENLLTALEEAYMWVGKAIRDEQVATRTAELQEGRNNG